MHLCPECIPISGCIKAPAGALLQHPITVLQMDGHKLQNQEMNTFIFLSEWGKI